MPDLNTSKKFFVSYKYKDSNVASGPVSEYTPGDDTNFLYTPRHYVDKIIEVVGADHIYKGEWGDEGMDDLSDDTTESKLRQKIFDSSITIVLISPNMWNRLEPEKDQWIPREISYSLRDKTRNGKTSKANAMLAVALPDMDGKYDHAVTKHTCQYCNLTVWHTDRYFSLLQRNMFNRNSKNLTSCNYCYTQNIHTGEDHSYVYPTTWINFINNHDAYINHVLALRDQLDHFDVKSNHI